MPGVANLAGPAPRHAQPGEGKDIFGGILNTLADIETLRKARITEDRILRAVAAGEGMAKIAEIANQPVGFDSGLAGMFQRIGSNYGGGVNPMRSAVTQGALSNIYSPSRMSPSQQLNSLELDYLNSLPPEERDRIIREKITKPGVQVKIGGQPWEAGFIGQEGMGKRALQEHKERMGLSTSQLDNARKSVKTLVQQMGTRRWKWGTKNYARGNLIQGYKQYRAENDYDTKTSENRKKLDEIFDGQMVTYNKAGYKDIGKGEFDWDPKDTRILGLRKEAATAKTGIPPGLESIWGRLTQEEKETAKDYINQKMQPAKIVEWFETHGGGYQFPKQTK